MADEGNEWGDKILSDNGIFTTLIVVFFFEEIRFEKFHYYCRIFYTNTAL